jgi:hypothetical protein
MKKKIVKINLLLIFIILLNLTIFTYQSQATLIFADGNPNYEFDAVNAYEYMYNYTLTPNPAYKFYSGTDCTNFASQVLYYAGMAQRGTIGYLDYHNWYYNNPNIPTQVSRSWTYAPLFRQYWAVDGNGIGSKRACEYYEYTPQEALNKWNEIWDNSYSGCVYQLINAEGEAHHSMLCSAAMIGTTETVIETSQHSPEKYGDLREILKNLKVEEPNSKISLIYIRNMRR